MLRALIFAGLVASSPAYAQKIPIDDDFQMTGVEIKSLGQIGLAVAPKNVSGRIAVCGLAWSDGKTNSTTALMRQAIDRFYFRINGHSLDVQNGKFTFAKSPQEAQASLAGCSVSSVPWSKAGKAPTLEIKANFQRPLRGL